jgi:hypothetical protein
MSNPATSLWRLVASALLICCLAGCMATNPADSFRDRYHSPPLNEQVLMILDPDADLRREGINHLAASNVAQEPQTLLLFAEVAANDTSAFVRSAAIGALADGDDPAFAGVLIDALDDPSPIVRADAAKGLGQLVVVEAQQPLLDITADRDEERPVRVEATRSLRHYRDLAVAEQLVRMLDQRELILRHEAHDSLVAIYQVDLGDSPRDWPRRALVNIPAPAAEPLPSWIELFRERQHALRQAAMDEEQEESDQWHEDYRRRYPTFPQEDDLTTISEPEDTSEPADQAPTETTDAPAETTDEWDMDFTGNEPELDGRIEPNVEPAAPPEEPPAITDLPTPTDETDEDTLDEEWEFNIDDEPAEDGEAIHSDAPDDDVPPPPTEPIVIDEDDTIPPEPITPPVPTDEEDDKATPPAESPERDSRPDGHQDGPTAEGLFDN